MQLHERLASANAPTPGPETDPFAEVKNSIHLTVISELGRHLFSAELDPTVVRQRVTKEVRRHLEERGGIAREDRDRLVGEITDDTVGHGPLEPLLADESVTEIMVN